jgi:hypothetical protein
MKAFDSQGLPAHSHGQMTFMKRLCPALVALLLLTGADQAGAPKEPKKTPLPIASSGVIESFKIPERDASGNLIWLIQGEKAKIIEEGRIRIFNVQVDTYRRGEIDQSMTSPECFLIRQTVGGKVTTHAESTNKVSIVGKNIIITADGFRWFPEQTRFVMQKNVQVVFERKKGAPLFKSI